MMQTYDVVIIGGAIMGSSAAWFLTEMGFDGRILVVERDPSYLQCSTTHTNSCIRQQFSTALNIRISQFTAEFIRNLPDWMGGDRRVPRIGIQNYGYLYLADNPDFADVLRANQQLQISCGTETRLLNREAIAQTYPFFHLDDIELGSINTKDEGYWDGGALFEWFRRSARERGVVFLPGEVTNLELTGSGISGVTLKNGEQIPCGLVVNAAGPRAAQVARMAGIDLPVEPRKRFTWVFSAKTPLDRDLPLTIDPSGVHMRQDGPKTYLAGCAPHCDHAVDPDDFGMDHSMWETHVWPTIARRIPQFDALKIVTEWTGHYAYNRLDQNAVLGPHPEIGNFMFLNGFSGHGLQQSPAMGRGIAELVVHGCYTSLDLSPFGFQRIAENHPIVERAVI